MCSNCHNPKNEPKLNRVKGPLGLIRYGLSLLFIGLIRVYQYAISPLLPSSCRFVPSCSLYGIEAFGKYNPLKALYLTFKRIARCNPWGGSGFDPLP